MAIKPGICKGKESNPADPEAIQHYLMDSQKDHQGIQPTEQKEKEKSYIQVILINPKG